eukprot:6183459-Pleurochrysis_carterae.AAC.1
MERKIGPADSSSAARLLRLKHDSIEWVAAKKLHRHTNLAEMAQRVLRPLLPIRKTLHVGS